MTRLAFGLLLIADPLLELRKGHRREIMGTHRQPSQHFISRLKGNSARPVKQLSAIRKFRNSDYWLWAEVGVAVAGLVGLIFIIPTGYALWVDLEDRQTQRIVQAWQLVTHNAPGNSGKAPALEYLNNQGISLVGINLSPEGYGSATYLFEVNLPGADLREANLHRVDLFKANLSEANLINADVSRTSLQAADLSGAILIGTNFSSSSLLGTDLSGADLRFANLTNTYLSETNFSGAILIAAVLSGADLREAKNLPQTELDMACGDEETQLPKGFTIKACLEK